MKAKNEFKIPTMKRRREMLESAESLDDLYLEEEQDELRLFFKLPKIEESIRTF